MSADTLTVLISGRVAGHVTRRRGRSHPLMFEYDEGYAADPLAVPLSLSMPVAASRFSDGRVEGWMSGLLPGHSRVRAHWAALNGAASAKPFDLLSTRVGLECAGAVQFCKPERAGEALGTGGVDWLNSAEVERMVSDMVRRSVLWGRQLGRSAFSLAGAHTKVALYRDDADPLRWGESYGTQPTTHILKPSMPDQHEQSINEHLCMATACIAGLDVAETELQTWAGQTVVIVRRFDRVSGREGVLQRVHQEDLHQAAGDCEASIYQGDGEGHSPGDLARLLRDNSTQSRHDIAAFFDALAFNWLICNVDAHSKNYSVLLGPNQVRLAPLYDIWSIMAEDPHYYRAHSMAMSVLADRRILAADNRLAWEATAATLELDRTEGPERAAHIVEKAPAALDRAISELDPGHRATDMVRTMAAAVAARSTECLAALSR